MLTRSIGALLGAWWFAPTAQACSVCFSAKNEDNQIAYIATTGLLTFIPLLFAGALIMWVRRRANQLRADELPLSAGE